MADVSGYYYYKRQCPEYLMSMHHMDCLNTFSFTCCESLQLDS